MKFDLPPKKDIRGYFGQWIWNWKDVSQWKAWGGYFSWDQIQKFGSLLNTRCANVTRKSGAIRADECQSHGSEVLQMWRSKQHVCRNQSPLHLFVLVGVWSDLSGRLTPIDMCGGSILFSFSSCSVGPSDGIIGWWHAERRGRRTRPRCEITFLWLSGFQPKDRKTSMAPLSMGIRLWRSR